MSTILGLETLSEIFEYWGPRAGPMVWKWKAAEVRKILCLRCVLFESVYPVRQPHTQLKM